MDVIVRDTNGNEMYRTNRRYGNGDSTCEQWEALTGYDLNSVDVAWTADYIVVTVDLQDVAS